ncbi:MXAN_2562 family outer membrane beta-barrel protein [Vulgatibacter sp.]|uniref:MXAN_2562 family outer membrane beta-barrel protein n=1 Tax=Vulgatibacter sp. TaxID=1971226 RepID=UPI0035684913
MNANFFRLAALLALLAPAAGAAAQSDRGPESPRDWMLHLQFGGYYPSIDDEAGLAAEPFAQVFDDSQRLLTQLGLERYAFKDFGTLGIGVSVGFVQFYGEGFFAEGPQAGQRSEDDTSFTVVPLQAYAAYRFDKLALDWAVPLVPYAKAGVGSWFWWTGGESGARPGFSYGGGLQILLDYFDRRLARDFDRNVGVNNSYLFVDWTAWQADGFGSDGFDLSDDGMFSGGLALDF